MAMTWRGDEVYRQIEDAARRAAFMAGTEVHAEAVRLIQSGPKSGRVYRRRGVTHRASAPGQPPASDTGSLAGSGDVNRLGNGLTVRVTFRRRYARALELGSAYRIGGGGGGPGPSQLEFGTQTLAPRPFLRPALQNKSAAIFDHFASEIGAVIRQGGAQFGSAQRRLF